MLKRIMAVLLVAGMLLMCAGCGSKTPDDRVDPPVEGDETFFSINGREFHLDRETEFNGLDYLISKDFKEVLNDVVTPYVQYNYLQEDSSNLLFFRIFFYENKDVGYALNDLGLDRNLALSDGSTENLQYKMYAEPRDDGGTIHFYFLEQDSSIYVLNFVSKYDIRVFEDKVLHSMHF